MRSVSRREALNALSATDRDIVGILSEHRVATTQQIQTLLELPERTARYRLDRLWQLGLCGGRQPYADQGSAPYHWWPSRLADAFYRGRELPRGGERDDPEEAFLRHAAAITGLYVALHRLAPALGWEVLSFSREAEGREEFEVGQWRSAVVPDAAIVVREGAAAYHALVEVDRGTMSIPRLGTKLRQYLGWAASGMWRERHPYLPAVLFLTTTARRVEQILARAEERCRDEARRTYQWEDSRLLKTFLIAGINQVDHPERAIADPVWTARGKREGLRLADLLREPWERWRAELERDLAATRACEERRARLLADPEALRRKVQARSQGSWYGVSTYDEHLRDLDAADHRALQLLLEETESMGEIERRAYHFFQRRTVLDSTDQPHAARERIELSEEERQALVALRAAYLGRHRELVASLHARYPHLPWVLRAIRQLDTEEVLDRHRWRERHQRTKKDLAELKRLNGRVLDYLEWRKMRVSDDQWGAGWVRRHGSRHPRRLARAVDEEQLRACPVCEQLVVPSRDDPVHRPGSPCPFCGEREKLLSPSAAQASGLLKPAGEGSGGCVIPRCQDGPSTDEPCRSSTRRRRHHEGRHLYPDLHRRGPPAVLPRSAGRAAGVLRPLSGWVADPPAVHRLRLRGHFGPSRASGRPGAGQGGSVRAAARVPSRPAVPQRPPARPGGRGAGARRRRPPLLD